MTPPQSFFPIWSRRTTVWRTRSGEVRRDAPSPLAGARGNLLSPYLASATDSRQIGNEGAEGRGCGGKLLLKGEVEVG